MAVSFVESGERRISPKRSSTTSGFAEFNTSPVDEAIGPSVIALEDTWNFSSDLPFFDPRLIVDTCAQFVSSSYQARTSGGEIGNRRVTPRRGETNNPSMPNSSSHVPMLQAMVCHAHEYAGADRLVMELVPRCKEFKEQLRQTVRPLCAEIRGPNNHGGTTNEPIMEYEVDRFFRARLVQCDLSELLTYDCFADVNDDDGALARHSAVTKIPKFNESDNDNRDYKPSYDAELELSIERFELRFWRCFAHGMGLSLFGAKRLDLVERFEASAQDVFDRYQGELQLAMNSLMGWLPSWLSESLFIAFVGLGASVAIRQRSAKYTMLHRCVKSLLQSSGRYVFISTPGWYLPLVNWLPGLGRKEMLRMPSVMLSLSLRTVWPSPCLDPDRCVAAVDDVWGGPKGSRKAHLKLADGVESMGSWILRMTFGCERLFSHALQVVREYAPVYEEAFESLVQDGAIYLCELPVNQAEARKLTQGWAEKVHTLGNLRRRKSTRLMKRVSTWQSNSASVTGAIKRASQCSTRFNYDSATQAAFDRKSTTPRKPPGAAQLHNISHMNYLSRMPILASWERHGADDDGNHQPSILAQLHVDSHGPTTSSEPRLRSVIATGEGDNIVWWPLGQSDTFRERIPIHRTPDLAPNAAPPILEDITAPMDFMLPDSAVNVSDGDFTPRSVQATPRSGFGTRSPQRSPRRTPRVAAEDPTSPSRQGSDKRVGSDANNSPKGRSRSKKKFTTKEAFDPAGWQLQWFGLGRGMHAGGPTSSQSAPQLTMPEDFRDTLDRMWQKKEMARSDAKRNGRALSAPAAFDTSDFDVGDPAKNTVVAYALQMQIRTSLSTTSSEGPLRLAWRQHKSLQEASTLLQVRFNLGSIFLLAAMRAPLPSWEQLPLSYFSVLDEEVVKHSVRMEPPKVRLPDGVYAMGCSPLFHYIATEDSARVPPSMAQAFHVGVPHAFLEDGPIRAALVERRPKKRWSEGSLLVLFTAGAFTEGHLARRSWAAERGWLQQDYASFFPLACCFRLILGLEFLGLLHRHRPGPDSIVRLEIFLQFLEGSDSANKDVKVKVDMSADNDSKPLLIAPWLLPQKTADPEFNPRLVVDWDRACHPGNEGVALEDFAAWVSWLQPGRIIYSSHRSPTGDLYWKLENALIIFAFSCAAVARGPLSGQMIFDMYEDAVGDPSWWQVEMISYIVMAERISIPLDTVMGSYPSIVYGASETVEGCDETSRVLDKTEIVVCNPKMLNAFLGPVRAPVFAQTQLFSREIVEQDEESKLLRQLWMQRHQEESREDAQTTDGRDEQDDVARRLSQETEQRLTSQCSGDSIEMDRMMQSASPDTNADDEERQSMQIDEATNLGNARMSVLERLQLRHAKGFKGSKKSIKRGEDALVVAKRILNQRGGARSPSNRKLAQGSAMKAVEWRAKRAGKPKAPQIGQNLDLLQGLLAHNEEHLQKLFEAMPDLLQSPAPSETSPPPSPTTRLISRGVSFLSAFPDTTGGSRPNSRPSTSDGKTHSRPTSPRGSKTHSRPTSPRDGKTTSRPTSPRDGKTSSRPSSPRDPIRQEIKTSPLSSPDCAIDQPVDDDDAPMEESERGRSTEPKDIQLSIRVDSESDDGFGEEREVRIERLPSPVRTDKSRKWRPPTPFPRLGWSALKALDEMELAGIEVSEVSRQDSKQHKHGKKRRSKREARLPDFVKVDDAVMFDFCGFGNWKPVLKDFSKNLKRQTRTSNSDIPQIMRHG